MDFNKKRWFMLAACCLINLCLGSIYAWSVFAQAMADYLNQLTKVTLTASDLSIVYTIANSVGPITMICGGWFNDRFGARKVILIGGLLFGGGMILSGFANSVGFLIITYGFVGGLGLGMAYGCTISSCVKYFPDKRGLAGGVTTAAYGLGSVILPPVITIIVKYIDAGAAFKIIGTIFLIIICICSFFIIQSPLRVKPKEQSVVAESGSYDRNKEYNRSKDFNWKAMIKTPYFYIMMSLLICGAFCGMMIISQALAVARNMVGMSAIAASTSISVLALFNASGRVMAGYVSDKIGRINTLAAACVISIIGMCFMYLTGIDDTVTYYVGISLVGVCFGAFMGVFPSFTADQFGTKNNSVNYGIMFIGFALAGYFGPSVMRNVYSTDGNYQRAFLIGCGLNAVGIMLIFIYRAFSGKNKLDK